MEPYKHIIIPFCLVLLIIFNADAHLYINVHILALMVINISLLRMLYIFKRFPLKIFTKIIVISIQVLIFNGSYVF